MGVLAALAIAASVAMCSAPARTHDIYKDWRVPNNKATSCCHDADCRPTRAYVHDDGRWRAWNGVMWLVIPPERMLPSDYAGDGRSHLCAKDSHVYCFTAAEPKG